MARHHGDEPTPVDPGLDDLLFGPPERQGSSEPPERPSHPDTAVPDDWWGEDDRIRPGRDHDAGPTRVMPAKDDPTPRHDDHGGAPQRPLPPLGQPRPSGSGGSGPARVVGIALLLLASVLVGAALAYLALTQLRDDGGNAAPDTGAESTQTSSATSEESQSSPPSTSSSSSSTSSSSSSTTAKRTGQLPSGAAACGGAKDGVAAGRTTSVTSCPFALAVRDAYLQADPAEDGAATLQVKSPVTGRTYTMRCTGDVVTTCSGGNDASVVLY